MADACEIPLYSSTDKEVEGILRESKTIAVIGLSPKEDRASNRVTRYMIEAGYEIIPVNPKCDEILGRKSYSSLSEVPVKIDIVDIFRKLDAVPGIVDEAIKIKAKTIWMQENIVHNVAAKTAKDAGLKVVMNKCIKVEHQVWLESKK
jgi:predicted CoA-binding protein